MHYALVLGKKLLSVTVTRQCCMKLSLATCPLDLNYAHDHTDENTYIAWAVSIELFAVPIYHPYSITNNKAGKKRVTLLCRLVCVHDTNFIIHVLQLDAYFRRSDLFGSTYLGSSVLNLR